MWEIHVGNTAGNSKHDEMGEVNSTRDTQITTITKIKQ